MTVATRNQPDVTTDTPSEYVANIDASLQVDGELSGQFAPHEAATPNMTVLVDAGRIWNDNAVISKTQQTSSTITAPTTNPRIDRIAVDQDTGNITVITGTEAASPVAPDYSYDHIPIAQIALQTTTTQITNSIITDERASVRKNIVEGTWTPNLWDASLSSAEGQTYAAQIGNYVRMGDIVYFTGILSLSSLGTLTTTDNVYIGPLPFTSRITASLYGVCNIHQGTGLNAAAGHSVTGFISNNQNFIRLNIWDLAAGTSNMLISEFTASGSIIFSGWYYI